MKPLTIALGSVALAILAGIVTNWIRHRPCNLTRGTQHILLIGLMIQSAFIGVAIVFLIRSFMRGSQ